MSGKDGEQRIKPSEKYSEERLAKGAALSAGEGFALEKVSYRYPRAAKESLKKVSCVIGKGKWVTVLGPSGAGKSTLALTLNGLIPQLTEGELTGKITLDGQDISRYKVQTLAKHVGLVLQDAETQIFSRSVREDVSFGPRNYGFSAAEIERRTAWALKAVGLDGKAGKNTAELSGGEKQRLALAGILALEPEFIVLDEGTAELDPQGKKALYAMLEGLRRERETTIITVEQDLEEIAPRTDEVLVLKEGEIAWRGKPEQLFPDVPLVKRLGLRPLSICLLGWELYREGRISWGEIPIRDFQAERILASELAAEARETEKEEVRGAEAEGEEERERDRDKTKAEVKGERKKEMIRAEDLSYGYGPEQPLALHGINLVIEQGEFVALTGRNGSGKTTLAKHFNGLLQPGTGKVYIGGTDTQTTKAEGLFPTVGYVFQNPDHQIFAATVEREIAYGLKNMGLARAEIKSRVAAGLELTGLTPYRAAHPYSLGRGLRQIVAVASVIVLQPKVLVLDEPTAGLGWQETRQMMVLLEHLNREGTTVILISHDMELVARYAGRMIVMAEGRIVLDKKPEEAFACPLALEQAGLGVPPLARLADGLREKGPAGPAASGIRRWQRRIGRLLFDQSGEDMKMPAGKRAEEREWVEKEEEEEEKEEKGWGGK